MPYQYQEYPKFLYHPTLAREGKIFKSADETKGLARKGWVDSPDRFPKPSRLGVAVKLWWSQWEWAVRAVAVFLGLAAALIALIKVLLG